MFVWRLNDATVKSVRVNDELASVIVRQGERCVDGAVTFDRERCTVRFVCAQRLPSAANGTATLSTYDAKDCQCLVYGRFGQTSGSHSIDFQT
jgi:hypothetical protein